MKANISLIKVLLSILGIFSVNLFSEEARYSDRMIDRPGIMPVGIINFDNEVVIDNLNSTGVNVTGQFGIVENLQGEVSFNGAYPFKSNTEAEKSNIVNLATRYQYLSLPHTSLNVAAKLPMHVVSGGEIVRDVTFGLPTIFYNDIMAGSILANLFTLTMRPNVEAAFNFPFWYGLQVYGKLWAMVHSSFGSVQMNNKNNQAEWTSTPFWKKLPATLAVTYVINHYLDVGATAGFNDVLKAKDTVVFGLNFSVRGGRIFG